VSTPLSPKPARIDGRRLRSERTKQLIIEAYLALLRENPVVAMPTAAQIADRAGYSVRSIFERFPDLSKLRVAAADYSLAQAAALAPARHVDGDRATRIRSQVETRAGTCERGVKLWRVLLANVADDEDLKLRVRIGPSSRRWPSRSASTCWSRSKPSPTSKVGSACANSTA
jgi:AcrR family transcriptional regulator